MRSICVEKLSKLITVHTIQFMNEGKLGCAEIIVNQNGMRVFHECYGVDNATGRNLTKNTLFRAASMTKPITTVAFLRLFDEGYVDMKAPLSEYLPEFSHMYLGHLNEQNEIVIDKKAGNQLFLYQLFCHTSGIGVSSFASIVHPEWKSTKDTCLFYSKMPLAFEPGSTQCYSTTAPFDTAAYIIERITGMQFAEYVRRYITDPLEMKDTTYMPTAAQWARMVGMHDRNAEGKSILGATTNGCVFSNIPPEACAAGAGMITSAEDYSCFAEMLLNKGMGRNGVRILSERTVKLMSTPQVSDEIMDGDERWGLGVRVITRETYAHKLPIGSYGWSGAYGTHFWVDPVNSITAVYMKNSMFDGGAGSNTANCFEEDISASLI